MPRLKLNLKLNFQVRWHTKEGWMDMIIPFRDDALAVAKGYVKLYRQVQLRQQHRDNWYLVYSWKDGQLLDHEEFRLECSKGI